VKRLIEFGEVRLGDPNARIRDPKFHVVSLRNLRGARVASGVGHAFQLDFHRLVVAGILDGVAEEIAQDVAQDLLVHEGLAEGRIQGEGHHMVWAEGLDHLRD
jgi:hypothetical protein